MRYFEQLAEIKHQEGFEEGYLLTGLLRRFTKRVPDVPAILDAMTREGLITTAADIENDHIVFRSLGIPQLGISFLEKIFLHLGYNWSIKLPRK